MVPSLVANDGKDNDEEDNSEDSDEAILRQLEEAGRDRERFEAEEAAAAERAEAAAAEARRIADEEEERLALEAAAKAQGKTLEQFLADTAQGALASK